MKGHAIDSLISAAGIEGRANFYRTSGGAGIDLLLCFTDGKQWAIEIERSLTLKLERGFFEACDDIMPAKKIVVVPSGDASLMRGDVEAMPLARNGFRRP